MAFPNPCTPPATAALGALGRVCLRFVLQFLPRFLVSPSPPEPSSPFIPFSSLKSQVQFTRTAFSCPKQKGKGKEERNFRPLVRLQEEKEQHQNHKGKEKPSFLGNAHDLLSRYLDKSFLRKKKKKMKNNTHKKIENSFLECGRVWARSWFCPGVSVCACVCVCERDFQGETEQGTPCC